MRSITSFRNLCICVIQGLLLVSTLTKAQSFSISVNGPSAYCLPGQTNLSVTPSGGTAFRWFSYPAYPFGMPYTTSPVFYSPPTGMWICEVTTATGTYTTDVVRIQYPDPYITAPSGTTACTPGSVTLRDNASSIYAMSMYDTYQWRKDGINIPGATGWTYQASSSGTYTLYVSIGCGSAVSNPVTVTISNSIPGSTVISAGGPTTFCQGGSVNLSVPAIANSYQWKRNNTNISGATSNSYNASLAGSYTCVMTNSCGSFTTPAVNVTVNPLPSATITAGGATTFCQGGNVVLNSSTGAGYAYQWNLNSAPIPGATGSSYTASQQGSYSVTVTLTGCSVTSGNISVTVNPLPAVSFTGLGSSYICQSLPAMLTGSPSGGIFSGAGVAGNTFNASSVAVGGPYPITYTYTNTNGCSASAVMSTSVVSGINCLAPQNLSVLSSTTTSVTLSWKYSSANSFQIRYRKGSTGAYTTVTFTASPCQTTYTLTGLKKNTSYEIGIRSNCSSAPSAYSNTVITTTPNSRTGQFVITSVGIFPNPVVNELTIETPYEEREGNCSVSVVDLIGKVVLAAEYPYEQSIQVDVSSLPKGIYMVLFRYGDQKFSRRIVKE